MSKLIVEKEGVFLKKLNCKVFMNFITIEDDTWLMERFGKEELTRAMKEVDFTVIFEVFWRLLDVDSKRKIAAVKLVEFEGLKEVQKSFDDPVEVLKRIVCGTDEMVAILVAFGNTRAKSNADLQGNEKKSLKVGESSPQKSVSTSLPESMDTP